jgi:ATP-dependent Clp protease protease subunit
MSKAKNREKREKSSTRNRHLAKRAAGICSGGILRIPYLSAKSGGGRGSAEEGDGTAGNQAPGGMPSSCPFAYRPTPFILIPPDPEDGARIIRITGEVDEDMMESVSQEINKYNRASTEMPILAIICSGGGDAYAGLGIYDALKTSLAPVYTMIQGEAASAAALILQAGVTRLTTPNSTFMIHNAWHWDGLPTDYRKAETTRRDLVALQKRMMRMLAKRSGNSVEQIAKWCDQEYLFYPEQAIRHGFVDARVRAVTSR